MLHPIYSSRYNAYTCIPWTSNMDSIYLQLIYYTGFRGDLKMLWNQINSKVAQFLHFLSSLYFPLSQSMYSVQEESPGSSKYVARLFNNLSFPITIQHTSKTIPS